MKKRRSIKRNTRGKRKTQKMYYMKGCSKKTQRGGCGSCNGGTGAPQMGVQLGGSPVVSGNIGSPWTPTNLPGSTLISGNNNYYKQNMYDNGDPQLMMMSTRGGGGGRGNSRGDKRNNKRNDKRRRTQRGGGLIPQDLLNLSRGITYNFGSVYNALGGYHPPVNPLPYKEQYGYGTKPSFPQNIPISK